jgi:ABC-type antimicrobial peptide transport system permease subunit
VDEGAARRFWPGVDPIGKRITFGDTSKPDVKWETVVGLVGHTAHEGLDAEHRVQLYFPYSQNARSQMTFAVRTAGDPAAIVNSVRAAIREVDRDQPIADVFTMDALMDRTVGQRKLLMTLLVTFAVLAMVLSALGIYGVMAFDVTRRSREIGVRMALGASRLQVLALVLREAGAMTLFGIGFGIAGGLVLTRSMTTMLFGISPANPLVYLSASLLLAAVALIAVAVPSSRATRVDPLLALRDS